MPHKEERRDDEERGTRRRKLSTDGSYEPSIAEESDAVVKSEESEMRVVDNYLPFSEFENGDPNQLVFIRLESFSLLITQLQLLRLSLRETEVVKERNVSAVRSRIPSFQRVTVDRLLDPTLPVVEIKSDLLPPLLNSVTKDRMICMKLRFYYLIRSKLLEQQRKYEEMFNRKK